MRNLYKNVEPKIIIFSGAGLSAESGISTFRDNNGLWENHEIEKVCNESTWKHNFELVHEFYNERRTQLKSVRPNEAHKTIKRMYDKFGDGLIIATQNVDDLLERTGIPSKDIIHLHGELTKMHCTACGNVWHIGYNEWNCEEDRCPKCNSRKGVKPFIVFFGGRAPKYMDMYNSMNHLYADDSKLVVIGTLGNVIPIDSFTSHIHKSKKILNNLKQSDYINAENFGKVFYEPATTALPKIEELLKDWRTI